jgi:hypothetical protein
MKDRIRYPKPMKLMKLKYSIFASVFAIMAVIACKHHPDLILDNGNGGNNDTVVNPPWVNPHPCDPDTVYFVNQVLPLLISNCAQPDCHDAITHEDGVRMYSYSDILEEVDPFDPNSSDLIEVLYETGDNLMPPASAGGPLSQQQINILSTWINQGALNNECIPDCDPNAPITFAGVVQPIIQNSCEGCHSGTSPSGNLSLTNYGQISASALSGGMMNSLKGTNGASIMPQNTSGLPQCQIDQIQTWIDAGAPNN